MLYSLSYLSSNVDFVHLTSAALFDKAHIQTYKHNNTHDVKHRKSLQTSWKAWGCEQGIVTVRTGKLAIISLYSWMFRRNFLYNLQAV